MSAGLIFTASVATYTTELATGVAAVSTGLVETATAVASTVEGSAATAVATIVACRSHEGIKAGPLAGAIIGALTTVLLAGIIGFLFGKSRTEARANRFVVLAPKQPYMREQAFSKEKADRSWFHAQGKA